MIVWRRWHTQAQPDQVAPPLPPSPWLEAMQNVVCNKSLGLVGAQLQPDSGPWLQRQCLCCKEMRQGEKRGERRQSSPCCSVWQLQNICIFTFDLLLSLPCVNCQSEGANKQQATTTKALYCLCIYAWVCVRVCVYASVRVCAALTRTHYVGQMNGNCGTETSNWSATRWATQIDSLLWLTSVWPLVPTPPSP